MTRPPRREFHSCPPGGCTGARGVVICGRQGRIVPTTHPCRRPGSGHGHTTGRHRGTVRSPDRVRVRSPFRLERGVEDDDRRGRRQLEPAAPLPAAGTRGPIGTGALLGIATILIGRRRGRLLPSTAWVRDLGSLRAARTARQRFSCRTSACGGPPTHPRPPPRNRTFFCRYPWTVHVLKSRQRGWLARTSNHYRSP